MPLNEQPLFLVQAKLSPLHDSAGSQQSLEAENGDLSGSETSSNVSNRASGDTAELLDGKDKALNGISHPPEQDAAHFIGLPQKKSTLRSRHEPELYQLSCSSKCDSLLTDSEEVHTSLGISQQYLTMLQ